jgi:hypothetical protein
LHEIVKVFLQRFVLVFFEIQSSEDLNALPETFEKNLYQLELRCNGCKLGAQNIADVLSNVLLTQA